MNKPGRDRIFTEDGFLVVDKPVSLTSADVVNRIKKAVKPKKIGHTGTLDPFATGVLVICLNRATKLSNYLMDQDKIYEGVMKLGQETDTYDLTGRVVQSRKVDVTEEDILISSSRFVGHIKQTPPIYSALKRDGEALYKKARRGEDVEIDPREVVVHQLEITNIALPRVYFKVSCGKGVYIRSIAHDWGKALKCGGHLEELRRIKSGPFSTDEALNLGLVESLAAQNRVKSRLIPPSASLPDWPEAVLNEKSAVKVGQGRTIESPELVGLDTKGLETGQKIKLMSNSGALLALAQMAQDESGVISARPIRVLQINS
jgi:tRNA pseudouridine55 synthase